MVGFGLDLVREIKHMNYKIYCNIYIIVNDNTIGFAKIWN